MSQKIDNGIVVALSYHATIIFLRNQEVSRGFSSTIHDHLHELRDWGQIEKKKGLSNIQISKTNEARLYLMIVFIFGVGFGILIFMIPQLESFHRDHPFFFVLLGIIIGVISLTISVVSYRKKAKDKRRNTPKNKTTHKIASRKKQ